jgi:hypothetical protein
MDNLEYLAQIAAKPAAQSASTKLLDHRMIKLIAIAIIAIITIIVLASLLGSATGKSKTLTEQLYLRLTNLSADSGPITAYGSNVKSSELRSLATSLKSTLTNTTRELTALLPDLSIDPTKIDEKTTATEADYLATLITDLSNAKLNGILDRIYAKDIALQISDLLFLESSLLEKTTDEALIALVEQSATDLGNLHTKFINFSNSH